MDLPSLGDLLRRSRHRSLASGLTLRERMEEPRFYASLNQYSPEELSSIQSVASVESVLSASLATKNAAAVTPNPATATTKKMAAQAATAGTTRTDSFASLTYPAPSTTPTTSSKTSTSLSTSSIATTNATTTSTSSTPVLTITATGPSTSSTIISPLTSLNSTATNANASTSSTTTGMSTGGIVGVVLAVIVGLVVVGSGIGWLYRKYTARSYEPTSPWTNLNDNDVTPFPRDTREKSFDASGDMFSAEQPPVIGSRRALALARQNAFNPDGSIRPTSEIMIQRDGNRAGLGAGVTQTYGSFPQPGQYGVDSQGRPYNGQAGRSPMPHMMNDHYENVVNDLVSVSPPSNANSRQLLGPSPYAVNMGRPSAPSSNRDLMQHEEFGDDLDPMYEDEILPYTPRTATSANEWQGHGQHQTNSRNVTQPKSALPTLSPLSPLMGGFMAQQEQKKMYTEVARAAGIAEPKTPHSAVSNGSNHSNKSYQPFEIPIIRLPHQQSPERQERSMAEPFVHGRPLSPLEEVATPASSIVPSYLQAQHQHPSQGPRSPPSPVPSSAAIHEYNPFDNMPIRPAPAAMQAHNHRALMNGLIPQNTARTFGSNNSGSVPSPRFPPPTPGGMSVPGSVTGSPSPPRWNRAQQEEEEEDAYDGI